MRFVCVLYVHIDGTDTPAPITNSPTTVIPTKQPSTSIPSQTPTTKQPTTIIPTTLQPITKQPTTTQPTTKQPTTVNGVTTTTSNDTIGIINTTEIINMTYELKINITIVTFADRIYDLWVQNIVSQVIANYTMIFNIQIDLNVIFFVFTDHLLYIQFCFIVCVLSFVFCGL